MRYHMGGSYGVVHFKVTPDAPILAGDGNDRIFRETLHWTTDGEEGSVTTFIDIPPIDITDTETNPGYEQYIRTGRCSNWFIMPEFDLGFMNPGHYTLTFQFDTIYGNTWTKTVEVDIEDNTYNHINLYRVVKRNDSETFIPTDITINNDSGLNWLKSFQINSALDTEDDFEYREHNIFVKPFYGDLIDVNHTVIFDIPVETDIIRIDNIDITIGDISTRNKSDVLDLLNEHIPHYIWIASDPVPEMRIIGVCRYYGTKKEPDRPFIREIKDNTNQNIPDVILSFRFHPFMHTLVPLSEDIIRQKDLIYAIPHLGHSRDIEVRNWIFTNKTTGEIFESYLTSRRYYEDGRNRGDFGTIENYGGPQGWFITPQEPIKLKPGYYNIKLQYRKGESIQEFDINSAFLLEK